MDEMDRAEWLQQVTRLVNSRALAPSLTLPRRDGACPLKVPSPPAGEG